MLKLSTDDLRLIAERLLEDCDPKKYKLDDMYIIDLRDALINMVNKIEQTGEFEIEIPDYKLRKEKDNEDKAEAPKEELDKESPKEVDDERKTDKT